MAFSKISTQTSVFGQSTSVSASSVLPSQSGNSGKFLTTDATNASWSKPFSGDTKIGVGTAAQTTTPGNYSVGIGYAAGYQYQGNYSIAIGYAAGYSSQPTSSIILNASGSVLSGTDSYSFYVNPVRNDTVNKSYAVYYNPSTYEVTYDTASGGGGASALSGLSDVYISGTPATNYVLKYNGSAWAPAADATGSGGSSYSTVVAGDYYLAIDNYGGWQEGVLTAGSTLATGGSYSTLNLDVSAGTTTTSGQLGGANFSPGQLTYVYFYNSRISTPASTSVTVPSGAITLSVASYDVSYYGTTFSYPTAGLQITLSPTGVTKVGGSVPRTL